mgnify:CR=1 FL=1
MLLHLGPNIYIEDQMLLHLGPNINTLRTKYYYIEDQILNF